MRAKSLNLADATAIIAVALFQRKSMTTVEAAQLLTFHTLDRLPTNERRVLMQRARRALYRLSRIMPITNERWFMDRRHLKWTWVEDEEDGPNSDT